MMSRDIKVREPNAGKRKRIPFDPYLRREKMDSQIVPVPVDQVQQDEDDRDPDMIHHFRISARLEEEKRKNYAPMMGWE